MNLTDQELVSDLIDMSFDLNAAQTDVIRRALAALGAKRNESTREVVIEECAKHCESWGSVLRRGDNYAAEIRALKEVKP